MHAYYTGIILTQHNWMFCEILTIIKWQFRCFRSICGMKGTRKKSHFLKCSPPKSHILCWFPYEIQTILMVGRSELLNRTQKYSLEIHREYDNVLTWISVMSVYTLLVEATEQAPYRATPYIFRIDQSAVNNNSIH